MAGGVAVGLRGLLTGRGSAASSGADRRARPRGSVAASFSTGWRRQVGGRGHVHRHWPM